MSQSDQNKQTDVLNRERAQLLSNVECWLERPMIALAFVWLALLILEFAIGERRWTTILATVIWVLFIIDFALRWIIAPAKLAFLRRNWLTALSLLVPALRIVRVFALAQFLQVARLARGARLVRVVASVNRSMGALTSTMRRRGFGYVIALTVIVIGAGAAGMFALERHVPEGNGLHSFGDALWWTAMMITTMGTDYWPRTAEGRVLCFLLALYAFAVFGYVTATIASFFIGEDKEASELPDRKLIESLREEIDALRRQLPAKDTRQ